ncbi:MAG: hypothetical protein HY717_05225 [Planctomycetes bacterium]|nr:hypothetical protein [Planctomycetota bacterium]
MSTNYLKRRVTAAVLLIISGTIVAGIARFLLKPAPEPGSPPPEASADKTGPAGDFSPFKNVDLSRPAVLLESFEYGPGQAAPIGGGTAQPVHATEGLYSYQVWFVPDSREGLFCRPDLLHPRDFSRHAKLLVDAFNPSAPLPVRLALAGPEKGKIFIFKEAMVPLGASTLEFDLRAARGEAGFDLARVSSYQLYSALELTRKVEIYFDNLRLAQEGPAEEKLESFPPLSQAGNIIPDGDFNAGFTLWRLESYPGGRWHFGIAQGDQAFQDGPSLGLFGFEEGVAGIRTPDLSLPPGPYLLRAVMRGVKLRCEALMDQLRPEGWVTLRRPSEKPVELPAEWRELTWEFVVPPGNPDPRIARVRIEVLGRGDAFIDEVALHPLAGQAVSPFPLDPVPGAGKEPVETSIARLRWTGKGFEDRGRRDFPLLYQEEDVPLDDAGRLFHERCRGLGFQAAVDLGGALHSGSVALALDRAREHRQDGGVAAWLLAGEADWPLAGVVPGKARGLARRLAEEDGRLAAIGTSAAADPSVLRRFADAADALVVWAPAGEERDPKALEMFERAIRAARGCGDGNPPNHPVIARIPLSAAPETVRLLFFLALIDGASGVLWTRENGKAEKEEPIAWSALKPVLDELAKAARKAAAFEDAPIPLSAGAAGKARVRAGRAAGARGAEQVLFLANPTPEALGEFTVETPEGKRTISLGPWEAKVVVVSP